MSTRAPNRHPTTAADDPRCRVVALNDRDLVLSDDTNGEAWLACQDAPILHTWR